MEGSVRFKGNVAIVTGGGSGLGREIAFHFAREGALVGIPDINLSGAQETQKIIDDRGGKSLALKVDVSRTDDVKRMVKEVLKKFGRIDILVNNAGFGIRTTLLETPETEWDRVLAVDLRGIYLCIKQVVPEMIKIGKGKIVNISSVAGLVGSASPAYTAAKGGIISLTRVLAGEFAPYKINVNTVCPGFCATPANEAIRKSEVGEMLRQKILWGRWGMPEDVAAAVLFLSSKEAEYITGVSLPVDGGLSSFIELGEEYCTFDRKKGVS